MSWLFCKVAKNCNFTKIFLFHSLHKKFSKHTDFCRFTLSKITIVFQCTTHFIAETSNLFHYYLKMFIMWLHHRKVFLLLFLHNGSPSYITMNSLTLWFSCDCHLYYQFWSFFEHCIVISYQIMPHKPKVDSTKT